MSKRSTIFMCGLVAMMILLGGTAQAQTTITDHATLVSVGVNPSACTGPNTPVGPGVATIPNLGNKGVVNVSYNAKLGRFQVNVSVHDAQANTSYDVDIRCWIFGPQHAIGTLRTDQYGTGSFEIPLSLDQVAAMGNFYIDISVPNVGGPGSGGYGDTYIAGPLNVLSK
jgi:hypothetical protein